MANNKNEEIWANVTISTSQYLETNKTMINISIPNIKYADEDLTSLILVFFERYQRALGLKVWSISTNNARNDVFNYKPDTAYIVIDGSLDWDKNSSSPCNMNLIFDYEELLENNNVQGDFDFFLVGCIKKFREEIKGIVKKPLNTKSLYYPFVSAKIRGVLGMIIESIACDTRAEMLHEMYRLESLGFINIYELSHNGDISKPTKIQKVAKSHKYGWFVTVRSEKSLINSPLYDKKIDGERSSYKLVKKNFEIIKYDNLIYRDEPHDVFTAFERIKDGKDIM